MVDLSKAKKFDSINDVDHHLGRAFFIFVWR
jgi:hypothetical protein